MNANKQISWGGVGLKKEGTTVQCGRKFVGSATVTAHLAFKTDVGCGFSNSIHFVGKITAVLRTQTSGPFEVLPPERKKKKKKMRTFFVRGGGGVRPNPPAYGPDILPSFSSECFKNFSEQSWRTYLVEQDSDLTVDASSFNGNRLEKMATEEEGMSSAKRTTCQWASS